MNWVQLFFIIKSKKVDLRWSIWNKYKCCVSCFLELWLPQFCRLYHFPSAAGPLRENGTVRLTLVGYSSNHRPFACVFDTLMIYVLLVRYLSIRPSIPTERFGTSGAGDGNFKWHQFWGKHTFCCHTIGECRVTWPYFHGFMPHTYHISGIANFHPM